MRVAAGSRPGDRELPPVTPRLLLFCSLCPCCPRLFLLFLPFSRARHFLFSPDHGIISLKAHGSEGTTKEERLPYEADCIRPSSRVLQPLTPRGFSHSRDPSLFPSRQATPDGPSLSPSAASRRTRQVCPSSLFSALCVHSVLSVLSPYLLLLPLSRSFVSSFLSLPLSLSLARARAIYFVCLLRVPFCSHTRSLARSSARSTFPLLVRSPHRRVQTRRTILSPVPPFARSLTTGRHHRRRHPRERTSAHSSTPLARVLTQERPDDERRSCARTRMHEAR